MADARSDTPANDNGREKNGRSCPICGRAEVKAMRPFCSKRCADVDLNRWMTGAYAIPAVENGDGSSQDTRD
jgi:uncharacterized protein